MHDHVIAVVIDDEAHNRNGVRLPEGRSEAVGLRGFNPQLGADLELSQRGQWLQLKWKWLAIQTRHRANAGFGRVFRRLSRESRTDFLSGGARRRRVLCDFVGVRVVLGPNFFVTDRLGFQFSWMS